MTGLPALLRSDAGRPQLLRFAAVGGVSNLVYLALFAALHGLGAQPANLAAALTSTVLSNDLHRRLTFHADERVTWSTAQWRGGLLALAGIVTTAVALAVLDAAAGTPGLWVQAAVIGAVNGTVGLVRFLALRRWFRPR
ncbi:putative flippase GtrA [Blastococcus colisei]|uniref:Putative flippase GtrA n=1 Tax=Blastococcus colisei TaxID=1564162 RepID=A0A543PJA7_9ACTN|nr:GtrA family protein [Blastococcus colisei]TQN44154.1 putative flippase GtrA [Blastococcus colisei]